ncbi:MAG: hypothetical protein RXO22_06475 [Thermocladium sp.]
MSVEDDVKSALLGYLKEAHIDLIVFRSLSANSEEGEIGGGHCLAYNRHQRNLRKPTYIT